MPAMQRNRFELKYTISERKAQLIRQFIRSYLVDDPFNKPELPGYWIHSLYLDSPDLKLAKGTLHAQKNRFKLRIRFYEEKEDAICFCEIKERRTDIIQKQRAMVTKKAAARYLAGHWPAPSDLKKYSDRDWASLQNFCTLKNQINADGAAFVNYLREAFVSTEDESVRVTFDRAMYAGGYNKRDLTIEDPRIPTQILLPNGEPGVVLELKFVNRFPNWMRELVHNFQLTRCAMPKYVKCVTALQREQGKNVNYYEGKRYDTDHYRQKPNPFF